jgi:hypothetical protein
MDCDAMEALLPLWSTSELGASSTTEAGSSLSVTTGFAGSVLVASSPAGEPSAVKGGEG